MIGKRGIKQMKNIEEGSLLWEPSQRQIDEAAMTKYRKWLEQEKGLDVPDSKSLWEWSTTEVEAFWESVWEYSGVVSHAPYTSVLSSHQMPGAKWFEGATLIMQKMFSGMPVLISLHSFLNQKQLIQRQSAGRN